MSKETIFLQKPLKVNGKDLTQLNYDIDEISIEHVSRAEAEKAKILGKNAVAGIKVAQTDLLLHLHLGFQAIMICQPEIDIEDLKRIKGYDLTQIAGIGTRFFIPPTSQHQENSEKSQEDTVKNITVQ